MGAIGIYKITNPKGKVYIGQSINLKERERHYKTLNIKNQPKISNSIKKYGWDNHSFEIIEECDLNILSEREVFWKKEHLELKDWDWKEVLFCELHDRGGDPRPQEIKDKIRKGNLGKKLSPITRKRISQNSKGVSRNKGRVLGPRPQEVRDKIRNSRFKPILQYDLEGNFVKEWESCASAKKAGFKNIFECLRGKSKQANGYIWKYKN